MGQIFYILINNDNSNEKHVDLYPTFEYCPIIQKHLFLHAIDILRIIITKNS